MMRDIGLYTERYVERSFEPYQVKYRRRKVIEEIAKYKPQSILEIGCGMEPLFLEVGGDFTIVEPSDLFASNAEELSKNYSGKVRVIKALFENAIDSLEHYDMIICSSLVHELENPLEFIKKILLVCDDDTIVHINVPNANSMHRVLAYESGIISDTHDFSKRNVEWQQHSIFDMETLSDLVKRAGGTIIDSGSYFVKPFTHKQMLDLLDKGIITENVLDGFYNMTKYMPDLGSEIYVTCKKDGMRKK